MQGVYYKTVFRNQKTGEAEFDIIPDSVCENLDNGVLHCKGIIGIYSENTPIEIEGEFKAGFFYVNRCFVPYATKENTVHILRHISKELTDIQIEKIAEEAKGDIFSFINSDYGIIFTARVLKRNVNDGYVTNIVKKISNLGLQDELVKTLIAYNVPLDKIEALYKKNISISQIDKDPYMMFLKFEISIEIADRYASGLNIRDYDLRRLCGFTLDSLIYLKNNGNSYTTIDILTNTINKRFEYLGIIKTEVNKIIVNACISELSKYAGYHVIDGIPYIYLNEVWEEECNIINHIFRLSDNKCHYEPDKSIEEIEEKLNIHYNKEQIEAFNAVKTSGIKILTGPPGSGKTAVIRGLIEYFGKNGRVKLAATTGMAAKVMKDACKHNTQTANMMLNVIPFNNSIKGKDLNDPVNAEFIIVDEISMMGIQLFSVLVQAVKSGSILLLVGDEDQLQSVDYGNVLHDLIESGCIETYRLKTVMRSSGVICHNAGLINKGDTHLQADPSFSIEHINTEEELFYRIKKIDINRCQILNPLRRNGISTKEINKIFVKKNNPLIMVYGQRRFHLNDRIIMTKTNYNKGYVNGDVGYVIGADDKERMIVSILDQRFTLDREDMQNVDFAYAITIHKSQGSEFREICIVLPTGAKNMMSRRLLYTAVTRAKEKVTILEMDDSLTDAILNNHESRRDTLLSQRIRDRYPEKT